MNRIDESPTWRLNPSVRTQRFDGGDGRQWLIELDDDHGRVQRITVSDPVHETLLRLRQPSTAEALRARLASEGWTVDALERLIPLLFEQAVRRNVLIPAETDPRPAPRQHRRPSYMTAMVRLIPARVVNVLARPLVPLFSRTGLALGAIAAIVGQILLFQALLEPREFDTPTSAQVLAGIAIALAVLLLHELGHAAAAWRAGARNVSIGAGWYVLFPVAYADLSEIWRYSAAQRALITVAGVFVQSVSVLFLMLLYRSSGDGLLLVAAVAASLSILWNLNPLLRLDGYWLLSDLLRSSNLRGDAFAALRHTWNRLTRSPRYVPAAIGALSGPVGVGLAVYALISTLFFTVVCLLVIHRFSVQLVDTLPQYASRLINVSFADLGIADAIVLVGGALWKLVLFIFLGRFLWQLSARAANWLRQRIATAAK